MSATLENKTVKVRILDKDVQLSCSADDEGDLTSAARYVNQSMQEFRGRNSMASVEKIAIVTAINMANDLLKNKNQSSDSKEIIDDITSMQSLIENALSK